MDTLNFGIWSYSVLISQYWTYSGRKYSQKRNFMKDHHSVILKRNNFILKVGELRSFTKRWPIKRSQYQTSVEIYNKTRCTTQWLEINHQLTLNVGEDTQECLPLVGKQNSMTTLEDSFMVSHRTKVLGPGAMVLCLRALYKARDAGSISSTHVAAHNHL